MQEAFTKKRGKGTNYGGAGGCAQNHRRKQHDTVSKENILKQLLYLSIREIESKILRIFKRYGIKYILSYTNLNIIYLIPLQIYSGLRIFSIFLSEQRK